MCRIGLTACVLLLFCEMGGCPGIAPNPDSTSRPPDAAGEGPRLGTERIRQEDIAAGAFSKLDLRAAGLRIFTTPFNHADGYGDGPMDPLSPTLPGARPTLQGNGVFLRVNGLDAQTCLECHTIVSNATIPATLGIGGAGAVSTNAIIRPTQFDLTDTAGQLFAGFDGRFANPPFLFGSGGIELAGKEMTQDLQALKAQAISNPGVDVPLVTKGVDFGVIRFENGALDTSRVVGIDSDLVVKPFGRKGEFRSVRDIDLTAMQFHFGMQPSEVVGQDVDQDHDGVMNEILPGEMSALHIFATTLPRSYYEPGGPAADRGRTVFQNIGCTNCHVPALQTRSRMLQYALPEVPEDPTANVYYETDLSAEPTGFDRNADGGIEVPAFSDLKRHDMGPGLAESAGAALDAQFVTARLWGIADTAPYLHDGRAMTLADAILQHGGEAQSVRDAFAALAAQDRDDLLVFLRSLRTPLDPTADLD